MNHSKHLERGRICKKTGKNITKYSFCIKYRTYRLDVLDMKTRQAPTIIEWKSLLKLAYPPKKSPSNQFYVSEKNRERAGRFYITGNIKAFVKGI